MYREFYNLKKAPFSLTPDPQYVYMSAQHREALSGLIYSAFTRPGLTVLVGEVGTGKTTLLYTLAELLKGRKFATGICTNPTMTREEFFDYVLASFGVKCPSQLKSRQLSALQQELLKNLEEERPSVLILDEAQRLSPELMEEVRLLTNLETPQRKLLQIIMAGQPELMETIRQPELRQLKQRVSNFCRLEPLSSEDVGEYITHRIKRSGLPEQNLFSRPVMYVIHEYSKGIPRTINTLCESALQVGFALQSPRITIAIVREAAKDLDLIPAQQSTNRSGETPPATNPFITSPPLDPPRGNGSSGHLSEPVKAQEPFLATVPLESYEARQKSFGLLSWLAGRWG